MHRGRRPSTNEAPALASPRLQPVPLRLFILSNRAVRVKEPSFAVRQRRDLRITPPPTAAQALWRVLVTSTGKALSSATEATHFCAPWRAGEPTTRQVIRTRVSLRRSGKLTGPDVGLAEVDHDGRGHRASCNAWSLRWLSGSEHGEHAQALPAEPDSQPLARADGSFWTG